MAGKHHFLDEARKIAKQILENEYHAIPGDPHGIRYALDLVLGNHDWKKDTQIENALEKIDSMNFEYIVISIDQLKYGPDASMNFVMTGKKIISQITLKKAKNPMQK